jgi:hypothetical protein
MVGDAHAVGAIKQKRAVDRNKALEGVRHYRDGDLRR